MTDFRNQILQGDSIEVLPTLPEALFDAVVTDPPYALTDKRDYRRASPSTKQREKIERGGFMGCAWDSEIPTAELWTEVLRVAKPGAHLLAFGGTRTFHRLTCNIEDAGWEIRDCLMWLYGTGFPKSKNLEGGHGTALKPSWEPVVLARKPLAGTVESNFNEYGTGCLNIDDGRIEGQRWPANAIFDNDAAAILDKQSGDRKAGGNLSGSEQSTPFKNIYGTMNGRRAWDSYGDIGGASRFFYTTKASKKDRGFGNTHPTVKPTDLMVYLIKLACPEGGLILDPFSGSGSTCLAARKIGRDFVGIELNPEYVTIAQKRLQESCPLLMVG